MTSSLTQQAYRQIHDKIVSGNLPVGRVISENRLAEELGFSRTPVGEAIRQLVHEGLLEQVPRYGTVVRQIDEAEMRDLFEIREALEGYAAVRAAARISPLQIAQLNLLGDEMNATADEASLQGHKSLDQSQLNRFLAADMAFHLIVICAAGNAKITKTLQQTQAILNIFRVRRREHDEPLVRRVRDYHERIVLALERADGDGAKCAMLDHIEASKRETLAYLKDHAGKTESNPVLTLRLPQELKLKLSSLEDPRSAHLWAEVDERGD